MISYQKKKIAENVKTARKPEAKQKATLNKKDAVSIKTDELPLDNSKS